MKSYRIMESRGSSNKDELATITECPDTCLRLTKSFKIEILSRNQWSEGEGQFSDNVQALYKDCNNCPIRRQNVRKDNKKVVTSAL